MKTRTSFSYDPPLGKKNIQSKFATLASLADKACWLGDGVALHSLARYGGVTMVRSDGAKAWWCFGPGSWVHLMEVQSSCSSQDTLLFGTSLLIFSKFLSLEAVFIFSNSIVHIFLLPARTAPSLAQCPFLDGLMGSMHYRLRASRGVSLGVVNFASHFICIRTFQMKISALPIIMNVSKNPDIFSRDDCANICNQIFVILKSNFTMNRASAEVAILNFFFTSQDPFFLPCKIS